MKTPERYQYCILRYMHDVGTDEVLNVASVLFVPRTGQLLFRRVEKAARLQAAFRDLEVKLFFSTLDRVGEALSARLASCHELPSLAELSAGVIPKDDSALRWSPVSFGITENIPAAFESIVLRFVERYARHNLRRIRDNGAVWKTVKQEIVERCAIQKIRSATVTAGLRTYPFAHCWMNHCLHVIASVSLDAVTEEEFADKTTDLGGKLKDLSRSADPFRLHAVLGQPQRQDLAAKMSSAEEYLRDCLDSERLEICAESDAGRLADQVAAS